MMKWKKIALLTAPLVIGGTVYAFAAGGSTEEQAAAATDQSSVSYKVVKAEALTSDEMRALQQAKVAPSPNAQQQAAAVEPMNPFVMYNANSAGTADTATAPDTTSPSATPSAPAPAQTNPNDQFDLASVKNFEWATHTTQGQLKLKFSHEDDGFKLEGELNGHKFEVDGQQAIAVLSGLMQNAHLNEALTATMQGKQVALDATTVTALQGLKVELEDGRKIESKAKGNNPKAQGLHDNGNHYGQEKNKPEKQKKDKGGQDDGEHGNGKHGHDD